MRTRPPLNSGTFSAGGRQLLDLLKNNSQRYLDKKVTFDFKKFERQTPQLGDFFRGGILRISDTYCLSSVLFLEFRLIAKSCVSMVKPQLGDFFRKGIRILPVPFSKPSTRGLFLRRHLLSSWEYSVYFRELWCRLLSNH